jgi:hypothetical protein
VAAEADAALRIVMLCVGMVAVTWLVARWVAWRRETFAASEPRRDETQAEYRIEPLDVWPDDEPPPRA